MAWCMSSMSLFIKSRSPFRLLGAYFCELLARLSVKECLLPSLRVCLCLMRRC